MAEEVIHTRTFQVTVRFTDEQRDRFLDQHLSGTGGVPPPEASYMSDAIKFEIMTNLEALRLDASVTIVERMAVG